MVRFIARELHDINLSPRMFTNESGRTAAGDWEDEAKRYMGNGKRSN